MIAIWMRRRRHSANNAKKSSNKVNRTNLIGVTYWFKGNSFRHRVLRNASADVAAERVISALSTGACNRKQHLTQAVAKHSAASRSSQSEFGAPRLVDVADRLATVTSVVMAAQEETTR
ncbi:MULTISPECIES: hypothetical protein [Caballeronia]|uniref:hypothetical protein n=1 Tax=Caballeronia TaxID=1827195 RepID=UPI0013922ED5|nr:MULTISPECIES: hypothetical protein [Caballeronia]MCG7403614.1 hypothetical protein [Caballeronia zhejiangensis]MDR5765434.1 hypothetical protein [Caballeronia sp. LZ028]MDR5787089.1 hypothetical protein [Caballeronia sp. LP003]MDR5793292.1 hypothetical protein [Caballeronia sp. LZ008]